MQKNVNHKDGFYAPILLSDRTITSPGRRIYSRYLGVVILI